MHLGDSSTDSAIHTTNDILHRIAHTFFSVHAIVVLVICVTVALALGRFIAFILRKVVLMIGRRADKSENLSTVNRLRRYETLLVLSIAIIRTLLLVFALYFWWNYVHPSGQPSAIIGASAVAALIISGALSPALRDIAAGSLMMAEQWYGVGDFIKVDPFVDLQGVVERVTLRSTRIRGLNGEIIWLSNQYVQGVRLAPKGIRTIALELFVTDLKAGEKLVSDTNKRLPIGPLLVVNPLTIVSSEEVGDKLWQITAVSETAPGREWLIEQSAVDLMKLTDSQRKTPVIAHGPLPRFADSDAERRFARTIKNARKRPAPKRHPRSRSQK